MRADFNTGLEKKEATELEANQRNTESTLQGCALRNQYSRRD
jgi:hypothetical protein